MKTPMKIKPGAMVTWTERLSCGALWHFIGRYKGTRKGGMAVIQMRYGGMRTVEKEKIKIADE